MKAYLKNYRQSPRKTRIVADLIRGKRVAEARLVLEHTAKRATHQLKKLLDSAVANAAHTHKADPDALVVKSIRVDTGVTLHRVRPVSRGAAHPINKRTSNVTIELAAVAPKKAATAGKAPASGA